MVAQFVKVYNQMASIITFENAAWEKRYWFLKLLVPKLNVSEDESVIDELLQKVDLSSYALAMTEEEWHITLSGETGTFEPSNSTMHGVHDDDSEKDHLDNIIKAFNERHLTAGAIRQKSGRLNLSLSPKKSNSTQICK